MNTKEIYLSGGCFWGMEGYFSRLEGVLSAVCGYANVTTENPSYEDVIHGNRGHAVTVKVEYDPAIVSLDDILLHFFRVINPLTLNQQGNDIGTQDRSGVSFTDANDEVVIADALAHLQQHYSQPVVVENLPLHHFYKAEEYHQEYLRKNPGGYCHIDLNLASKPL